MVFEILDLDNKSIYSTESSNNLCDYISGQMDSFELSEARYFYVKNYKEYIGWYICLLEYCSALNNHSILIHKKD